MAKTEKFYPLKRYYLYVDRSSYLEPVPRAGLNSQSRPAGPNSADAVDASTPRKGPVEIPSSSTSRQSGIYNTVDSVNYQQNYTELTGRHQYDDLHGGREKESIRYQRLTDQIYMQNIQNDKLHNPENPKENRVLHSLIFCCSVASLIFNCPVGIFSVCYAYMAKTEGFYPMKRYYLCMTLAVALLAITGFLISIILTAVIISNARRS
ncbi:uncharacterized protein LOC111136481 [Crassostrea virginica]